MSCTDAYNTTPHVPDEAPIRLPAAPPTPAAKDALDNNVVLAMKDALDNDTALAVVLIEMLLNQQSVLQEVADALKTCAAEAEADLEKAPDKAALLRLRYDLAQAMAAEDDDQRGARVLLILAALSDDQQREAVAQAMAVLSDDQRQELAVLDGIVREARHGG